MAVQDFATTFTGAGDAPQVEESNYEAKPKAQQPARQQMYGDEDDSDNVDSDSDN